MALLGGALLSLGSVAAAGEALPVGPPWKTSWTQAKRAALETGRPIFAYFTKHY